MLCFRFRSGVRRPIPRAAAIPRRRNRAERSRRSSESGLRFGRFAGPSRPRMDVPIRLPSRGNDGAADSAAVAAPPPSGTTYCSAVPLLNLCSASDVRCAQEQDKAKADAEPEPPRSPRLGAVVAEKRGISESGCAEPEEGARPLSRRRRCAAPVVAVEAPAPETNPSLSDVWNYVMAGISATAASNDLSNSKKPDHHGIGGEPSAADSSGSSARGATGEVIQRYHRIRVLGQGGCGTVWKARDTHTGDLVAVKIGNKEKDNAALLREAALLVACRGNPAVVGFREVIRGPGADEVQLVMDFVGPSLRDLLKKRGRLPEPETRRAMKQLLTAVEMMGRQGVVHGDLKPDNVLLLQGNKDDSVKFIICDLGLSVSVSDLPCHIDGTLFYSAPEQLFGEKKCGLPVDAWALGIVMIELLTGRPLVEGYPECAVVQLTLTLQLLGIPDKVSKMNNGVDVSAPNQLREVVPEGLLTQDGFDVLQGLIEYNPMDRLTPAAALHMPWFAQDDT